MINPNLNKDPTIDEPIPEDRPVMVAGLGTKVLKEIMESGKAAKQGLKKTEPPLKELPKSPVKPEAERINQLNLKDYDLEASHQTNFDMIKTTDDVKAVIADIAEKNKAQITEARRGVITHEQLSGLADDLGLERDIVQKVMTRESGGTLNAETILGARKLLHASADRIVNLAKKVRDGEATDREKLQFMRQIQFHQDYQTQFMGARAEAGRALNAFGIPTGTDPGAVNRLKELVDVVHPGNVDRMAQVLADAQNIEEVGKLVRLNWRQKASGVAYEVFINSILSGVKTHVVNTIGNALFQAMNIAETAVAAQIGRFMSGSEHVMVGEAKAHLFGMVSAYRDAMRVAWRGLRTGEGSEAIAKQADPMASWKSLTGQSKTESHYRKYIDSQTLEITGPAGRVIDFVGSIIRIPTERLLTAEDEFFKTMARRGHVTQMAYRNAMKRRAAEGLNDEDTARVLREFIDNPPANAIKEMEDHVLYATFQNPLGEKGRAAQTFLAKIPGLKWLAPFTKTPINLFKAGLLERSPLAVFSSEFRADIAAGGARRDMALARVSMGTLTMASVAVAVDSGTITGGGPSDPRARKVLEATGWRPYSIRVEDSETGEVTYQSYQRAEPLSYVIGATADMVEIARYTDYDDELLDDDQRILNLTASVVGGIANNTMSKTFVSGLADFNQVLSDPSRYMSGWTSRMTGAMIPYSSLRRDLSKIQDPIIRDAWDMKERLRAQGGIPGWSEDSPPALDVYGDMRIHARSDLLGVISPFPESPEVDDPVKLEVANLMLETKKVPLTMPSRRIEGMKLSNIEYNELMMYSRKELEFDGRDFMESIRGVMNSDLYLRATPDTQVILLKDVQYNYDKAARLKLYQENEDFRDRLNRYRAKKAKQSLGMENLPETLKNLAQ